MGMGDSGSQSSTEDLTPGELRRLLERIDGIDTRQEPPDPHATVTAVCEATGASPHVVIDLLEEIRREDVAQRVSERLRELEEPLFRVERPGPESPSSSSLRYFAREKTLNTILDGLPTVDRKPVKVTYRPTREERANHLISAIVLGGMTLLFLCLIVVGIVRLVR